MPGERAFSRDIAIKIFTMTVRALHLNHRMLKTLMQEFVFDIFPDGVDFTYFPIVELTPLMSAATRPSLWYP
jgi:hypothetical protein